MPFGLRLVAVCLVMPAVIGCARWPRNTGAEQSLLRPATPSDDAVTLEILFVRLPPGEDEAQRTLWQAIDEQQLPNATRRQMHDNGFRAGVVGGQVPPELAKLLNLTDQFPTEAEKAKGVDLENDPKLCRRLLQLRAGRRGEILASGIHERLPLLLREEDQVCGRTYAKAQGLFAVAAAIEEGGRVRLALTPELHHGDAKQQWNGHDGIFRLEMGRAKEVFDKLRVESALAPGQMLVLASLPDRPGSLGHHLFTDAKSGGLEHKMLVIRLAQMPPEGLFAEAPSLLEAPE